MTEPKRGVRFFIFESDGTLRCVSHHAISRLIFGYAAVPQFSGQTIRDVEVVVELKGKTPVGIVNLRPGYWHVDAAGRIDDGLQDSVAPHALVAFRLEGGAKVVALPSFQGATWTPGKPELAQIVEAIWPKIRPAGAPRPTFLKIMPVAPAD